MIHSDDKDRPRVHYSFPKADMHVHISLALSSELFMRRIRQQRTDLEPEFLLQKARRYYPDLAAFHANYEKLRDVTSTKQEMANVTQQYLERIAREGAVYAEISNSFRDPESFSGQIEAIAAGIEAAKKNTGIEARIVATAIRNHGPEKANNLAKYLTNSDLPYVSAFGLVGDESVDSIADYQTALNVAWGDAGMGLTPHVAEQGVEDAVDFLEVVPREALSVDKDDSRRLRVGHGTLVGASSELMREFNELGICFEVCLSANKRIDLPRDTRLLDIGDEIKSRNGRVITLNRGISHYYENLDKHPLLDFVKAGIPVCLGSDNPLLMATNVGKEYTLALRHGLTLEQLLGCTKTAIAYANVGAETRQKLQERVAGYEAGVDAGGTPDSTVLGYRKAEVAL